MIEFIKAYPNQVNAFAALCGIFVSLLSIVLTSLALVLQRRHNYKSVTPIASLPIADYENRLAVKLRNTGVGPLVVDRLTVSDGSKVEDDIISWMPAAPSGISWSTFYDSLDGLALRPGEAAAIIELTGDPSDRVFANFRDQVRRAMSRLTVTVRYRDIYERSMPSKSRDLTWFGRHFGASSDRLM
jgi:hypothetical protein